MSAVATVTIGSLLRESGLPRSEAQLLLCILLGRERAWLIAHAEETVDPSRPRTARDWFARRRAGEPIAYISGEREFFGLALRVTPEVLIPRPETELLVELALERIPAGGAGRVLDLGTGSGAVALALAHERSGLRITATDISAAALAVARGNAQRHGVAIDFVLGDWFDAVGPEPFDLIVSNPPYVARQDPHLERGDVRFEPRLALAGGDDGMEFIGEIAAGAQDRLRPGGWLLFEHGFDQGARCMALLRGLGYADIDDFTDLAGLPRVGAGRRLG
ncbi:MAG: peptide chain release factor N(5)-glutamine methyltransferase [Burkholderiales bacterium]